jgi:hypothetical protein
MVGAHLHGSRPDVNVLEHFLQKLHHLLGREVVTHLLSRVLRIIVLPTQMHLFLQWCNSAHRPIGGHTDPDQVKFF